MKRIDIGFRSVGFVVALASGVSFTAVAHAQSSAPAADAEASTGVQEIVVTAQKRAERLSKVPIAISAVTGDALETARIQSTNDLEKVVPGLVTNNLANTGNFWLPYIRGVGSNATGLGNNSSVATYIDGVYQPATSGNVLDLTDIERVEVLKGPQGTLFGRNATGGAINIITKTPSDSLEMNAEANYGRFNEYVGKAYLSGPLGETLKGSLAFQYRGGGKYITNLSTGGKYGGFNNTSAHGKLVWTPSDRTEITASVFYSKRDQDDFSQSSAFAREGGTPVPAQLGATVNFDKRKLLANFQPFFVTKTWQGQLRAKYAADGFDLISITGYQRVRSNVQLDFDTSTLPIFYFLEKDKIRAYTEELQLVSNGSGPFKWLLGAYYSYDNQAYAPLTFGIGIPYPGTPAQVAASPGGNRIDTNSRSLAQSYAAFAQGTYTILPQTNLTLGLRYTKEKRELDGTQAAMIPTGSSFTPFVVDSANAKRNFSKVTWRISLDHSFGDAAMVYASFNRGFKSGVFNPTSLSQPAVNPEVLDAYEVGAKLRGLDGKLTFNAAAFYYDYKNIQVQITQAGSILLQNAASARIQGLDFDFVFRPIPAFTLRGGLNILDTKYKDYFNASTFLLIGGAGVNGTIADASGMDVVYAPKYAYNLGADYRYALAGGSSIVATANWNYSDKFKTIIGFGNQIRSYGTLTASLTWYAADEKYYVGVYGRNLTNVQDIGRYLNSVGLERQLVRPATYGLTVGVKFR